MDVCNTKNYPLHPSGNAVKTIAFFSKTLDFELPLNCFLQISSIFSLACSSCRVLKIGSGGGHLWITCIPSGTKRMSECVTMVLHNFHVIYPVQNC